MSIKLKRPEVNISGDLMFTSGVFEAPDCIGLSLVGAHGCISIGSNATMNLYGGSASQSLRHACVQKGGYLYASGSLAHVTSCYVAEGGQMSIIDGADGWDITTLGEAHFFSAGIITSVTVSGGELRVASCTVEKLTVCTHGNVHVASSGSVRGLTICNGGKCLIDGAQATDIEIHSGGTLGVVSGAATNVSLHSGGTLTRAGRCKIHYQALSEVGGAEWEDADGKDQE